MINIYGLNPFAEAMLYYQGKANNYGVKKRLDNALNQHPEHKKVLEKAAKPAKALEKLLDEKLVADEMLVKKFFKNFDGIEPFSPFGFCLASVMASYPLMSKIKQPAEKIVKYLRECSTEERMYSFCSGIADKNELLFYGANITDEFLLRTEKLLIPTEDKVKILTSAFSYQKNIDALLSLIIPAIEIIETAHIEYDDAINEFRIRYSSSNALNIIDLCFTDKLPDFENLDVVPSALGFNSNLATFDDVYFKIESSNSGSSIESETEKANFPFGCMLLGIGRHLIGSAAKNEIPALCNKIKALSDTTRLEMLFYLCSHKAYGQELCTKFDLGQSAVSYHMTKLSMAGFVTAELSGGRTYYSADKAGIQRMLDAFAEKIK